MGGNEGSVDLLFWTMKRNDVAFPLQTLTVQLSNLEDGIINFNSIGWYNFPFSYFCASPAAKIFGH